jgi:hypothetical protein
MESKISEKYQKSMRTIIESDGLISLSRIYEDYGRPKCKSPRRVFSYKNTKQQVEYAINESGYMIEKVIQYTPDDILVCGILAMMYLNQLDVKSYFHYYFGDNSIFKTGDAPFESFFNYYSLQQQV